MSQPATTAELPRSAWIISPAWDMAYLVATPLAIVPIVWAVSRRLATPEQIDLVVASFASLGHHLPGFMRCYGDHELFTRFRWRFLVAPPIFLAVSYLFVSRGLHGLSLVLLLWGTWHGLMQTYGLMRIYDLKRGNDDPRTARLDFWLCVLIFTIGMIFSEARVYGVMGALWQSGIPTFSATWLTWARGGVAIGAVALAFAYLLNLRRAVHRDHGVSGAKLLLAISTGGLYWISGSITTNLLIGIAMFEIFHATQYYAIVWKYNRRLAERAGERFGPLRFLFQGRWVFLGIYLAAIVSFGCIRFFGGGAENPTLQTALLVTISTSTLMHFYFDGFIWKVREKNTQLNLDIELNRPSETRIIPALVHAARFSVLIALLGGLFAAEHPAARSSPQAETELLDALAAWTPELPELQAQLSRRALELGHTNEAIEIARQAVRRRPRWHAAHADLGTALLAAGRCEEAVPHLTRATELRPRDWQNHHNLAAALDGSGNHAEAIAAMQNAVARQPAQARLQVELGVMLLRQGQLEQAEPHLRAAVELDSKSAAGHAAWAQFLVASGRPAEAITSARRAARIDPDSAPALLAVGQALNAVGKHGQAIPALEQAIDLDDDVAETHYQLGVAHLQEGHAKQAMTSIDRALELQPVHPLALFQRGNFQFLAGNLDAAEASYRRVMELDPNFPDVYNNLGAVLLKSQRIEAAVEIYERAIALQPDNAEATYNLGLAYLQLGRLDEARQRVRRAAELGRSPSREVARLIGM